LRIREFALPCFACQLPERAGLRVMQDASGGRLISACLVLIALLRPSVTFSREREKG